MDNFDLMKKRLEHYGGTRQEDRMIKDKLTTLQRALLYSYQACTVEMAQPHGIILDADPDAIDSSMGVAPFIRALINPDKIKQDYDDKIISVEYKHLFSPGDVFKWTKTNSYWIIYTQELTEDAYFRGAIRRCRYRIKFKDENGKWCSTWAAIRGPVETAIDSVQKHQERIDRPNLSLNILMPQNEQTLHAFDRYKEFLFKGKCWQVKTQDSISMENVIEITAGEDYINQTTDDITNEIKDGLVIEPITPIEPEDGIKGEIFIKPLITETYFVNVQGGKWSVLEKNVPVALDVCSESNKIQVTWCKATSGQFTLKWSNGEQEKEKTIVVESLF